MSRAGGQVLDTVAVSLNGEQYLLARTQDALKARRWKVEAKAQATTGEHASTILRRRPNVRPGDIDGEWIATYEDWSKGLMGDTEDYRGGGLVMANGLHGLMPHAIRPCHKLVTVTHTTEENTRPAIALVFQKELWVISGRYARRFANGTVTDDRDFGAGVYATDAIVHNNVLVVGFGGSANGIQYATSASNWTTDADVFATHFAHVLDRLWRCNDIGTVSNIGPTDAPQTLGNWSTGITVGDSGYGATDLNGTDDGRVVVSKVNGLFPGDAGAQFKNVLPELENAPDPRNGRGTMIRGADIFYPTVNDLLRYDGGSVEAVGLRHSWPSAATVDMLPDTRTTGLCMEGQFIWACTPFGGFPRVRPTAVQVTTDNGSTYASYSVNQFSYGSPTGVDLSSLDTAANGDWMVVGFAASTPIYGLVLDLSATNSNASTMTVQYWNGAAWTAFAVVDDVWDGTRVPLLATPMVDGLISLAGSGTVSWANAPTTVASTINSISAHYYRVSFSAALDSTVTVISVFGITVPATGNGYNFRTPGAGLFRGRSQQADDNSPTSIVWEPYTTLDNNIIPTAMIFTSGFFYPHTHRYGQLCIAGKQTVAFIAPPADGIDEPYSDLGLRALDSCAGPMDDMGMPGVSKRFLTVAVRGRPGASNIGTIAAVYRVDSTVAFAYPTSGTTVNATGTAIQLGYAFNPAVFALSAGGAQSAEVWPQTYMVEVRFRVLDTYKEQYTMVLECETGQNAVGGGVLPDVDVQVTALEALRGTSCTLIDPIGQSKTVTVFEVNEIEARQVGRSEPTMFMEVRAVEA